jgi:hypothetical protein
VQGDLRRGAEHPVSHDNNVRTSFLRSLEALFDAGCYVGVATHDDYLIIAAERLAFERKLSRDDFEFQMLLGVRPELGDKIVSRYHKLRIYVPFGDYWYEYSLRRLQENPSIAGYIASDRSARYCPGRNGLTAARSGCSCRSFAGCGSATQQNEPRYRVYELESVPDDALASAGTAAARQPGLLCSARHRDRGDDDGLRRARRDKSPAPAARHVEKLRPRDDDFGGAAGHHCSSTTTHLPETRLRLPR